MLQEIRCPKCGKLIGKAKENYKAEGIYLWCPRCKQNLEIQNIQQQNGKSIIIKNSALCSQ